MATSANIESIFLNKSWTFLLLRCRGCAVQGSRRRTFLVFLHFKNPACRLSANHSTELLIVIHITNCRWLSQLRLFSWHKRRCFFMNKKSWNLFYEGATKNHDKKEKLWKARSRFTEFKSISSVTFPRTEKLQNYLTSWHQNPRRMIFLPTFNLSWYPKPVTCLACVASVSVWFRSKEITTQAVTCFNNFFERLRFSPCAMACPSTIDFTYNKFHSRAWARVRFWRCTHAGEKSYSAKDG